MATTEQQIYQALSKAGFSQVQAAGIMGNMENESSFNVEANAVDSNGLDSYGLIQWNAATYPNASSLVTGNAGNDLSTQIKYLLNDTSGIGTGVQGSTAAQVASNFASSVEGCQGCAPGGAQNTQRQDNATTIYNQIKSGNWGPGGAGVTGASTASANCSVQNQVWDTIFGGGCSIAGGSNGGGVGGIGTTIAGAIGSGISSAISTSLTDFGNNILSTLGFKNWNDFFIRIGLIVMGAVVVIVGLSNLTDKGSPVQLPSMNNSQGNGKSQSDDETSDDETSESDNVRRRRAGTGSKSRSKVPGKVSLTASGGKTPNRLAGGGGKAGTGVSEAVGQVGESAGELAEMAAL